jgi:hypothetical protein
VAELRRKMQQPEYQAIYRRRAAVAEFSNACLKEKKGLRRFLRRGLAKVRAETTWACLSCNVSIWVRLRRKRALQQAPTWDTCARTPTKGPERAKRGAEVEKTTKKHQLILNGRRRSAPDGTE